MAKMGEETRGDSFENRINQGRVALWARRASFPALERGVENVEPTF